MKSSGGGKLNQFNNAIMHSGNIPTYSHVTVKFPLYIDIIHGYIYYLSASTTKHTVGKEFGKVLSHSYKSTPPTPTSKQIFLEIS